ncbi:MAG TPA: immunity 53 family protein [Opitutaceae bacterium]|nr:immunity 53 family protein [Opitutaceae bacterium]
MKTELERLQAWYAAQCNGTWEHEFGIKIGTIDNPGWYVEISLRETNCENTKWDPLKIDNGTENWISCFKKDGEFIGAGDTSKLAAIISYFLEQVADRRVK